MPYPGFQKRRDSQTADKPRRAPKPDTAGQTENFFTANVKLITLIVTLAILIIPAAIWGVNRAHRWQDEVSGERLIPQERVEALVARGSALTWNDFADYDGRVMMEDLTYICHYDVEGGRYYFWVTSAQKGGKIASVLLFDRQSDEPPLELIPLPEGE